MPAHTVVSDYNSFGASLSGAPNSTAVSRQDLVQIVGAEGHPPTRATLTLEASYTAVADMLKLFVETNTIFTTEISHSSPYLDD